MSLLIILLVLLSSVFKCDISHVMVGVTKYINNPGTSYAIAVKIIVHYIINSKDSSVVSQGDVELIGYSNSNFSDDNFFLNNFNKFF